MMQGALRSHRIGARMKLVLASQSPRRRELLRDAGLEHDAVHPGVDDAVLSAPDVPPEQWVAALAYLKASAGVEAWRGLRREGDVIVIGADTVCEHRGRIFAAPRDAAEARAMLRAMRADDHRVLTGVAFVEPLSGRRDIFVSRALVSMGDVPDTAINEYIEGGAWVGKAGAYNLSERLQAGWPIRWVGESATIMGLPIEALRRRLERFTRARTAA